MKQEQELYEFELADLLGIGMTFVVLGIGLSYGLSVMVDVRDDFCDYGSDGTVCYNSTGGTSGATESLEFNASMDTITAIKKIPTKLGLIVTIVLASVIIGILVRYLFVRFS
jgi:hypothetical protein